ncbi:BTB/POZ domain-containing protein KCTD16-like [Clytia hemisphaerica]|uniref:BTB domain-containing protein n=1 Tax=Clytia hemisphaerica TaxID=252671 RepID=A0A7M5XA97_9CNID
MEKQKREFEITRPRLRLGSTSSSTCSSSLTIGSDDLVTIGLTSVEDNKFHQQLPTHAPLQRRETFPPINTNAASLLISDSIELNVGGTVYTTTGWILAREHTSWLAKNLESMAMLDRRGRYFIDRDGGLFRYILEYLGTGEIRISKNFPDIESLRKEATFYGLKIMKRMLDKHLINQDNWDPNKGHYITLTEHATYNVKFRDNLNVVFKRISSITVAGHVKSCRKVFGNKLSLDRDSNENLDRYSCRMLIVQGNEMTVFDTLKDNNYEMVSNNKTDAASLGRTGLGERKGSLVDLSFEQNKRWIHVTNYYFRRKSVK